jgi:hypothetical protein
MPGCLLPTVLCTSPAVYLQTKSHLTSKNYIRTDEEDQRKFWYQSVCKLVRFQVITAVSMKKTDVSEVLNASIMRTDDGGSKHLWNVGQFLPDCTAQHPRRLILSVSQSLKQPGNNSGSMTSGTGDSSPTEEQRWDAGPKPSIPLKCKGHNIFLWQNLSTGIANIYVERIAHLWTSIMEQI